MKFFNIDFGTTNLFHNKCEYRSRCVGYKDNSYTCTKTLDKNYCGIYNQFLQETWNIKYRTIMRLFGLIKLFWQTSVSVLLSIKS